MCVRPLFFASGCLSTFFTYYTPFMVRELEANKVLHKYSQYHGQGIFLAWLISVNKRNCYSGCSQNQCSTQNVPNHSEKANTYKVISLHSDILASKCIVMIITHIGNEKKIPFDMWQTTFLFASIPPITLKNLFVGGSICLFRFTCNKRKYNSKWKTIHVRRAHIHDGIMIQRRISIHTVRRSAFKIEKGFHACSTTRLYIFFFLGYKCAYSIPFHPAKHLPPT